MEENSKRLKSETTQKLNELLKEFDGDDDDNDLLARMEYLPMMIKEEMVEEVMQDLYKEINPTNLTPPVNIPLLSPLPGPSSLSSSSSSSSSSSLLTSFAVTVSDDCKCESCGSFVSDSASTVMVGIEYVGTAVKVRSLENIGTWCGYEGGGCDYEVGEGFEESMDGCDGGEWQDDDEWLARLLSGDPLELDDLWI